MPYSHGRAVMRVEVEGVAALEGDPEHLADDAVGVVGTEPAHQVPVQHGGVAVEDGAEPDRLLQRRGDDGGVGVGIHAGILPRSRPRVRAGTVSRLPGNPPAEHAASRYDHQIVEFLRTAQQLDHIVAAHADGTIADRAMVDECERVISVENQGWMANWSKSG